MHGFLKAAIRSFAGRILGAASALVASYSVTSNLSVSDSGLFFLSLGFAIFFSHFLTFGLDNFAMKKCAIYLSESNYRKFISIVLACALICVGGSLIIYFVVYFSSLVVEYAYMEYLLLVYPAAIAIAMLGIIGHSLHAAGYVFTGAVTNTSFHYVIFTFFVFIFAPNSAVEFVLLFAVACYVALLTQIIVAVFLHSANGVRPSEWKKAKLLSADYWEIYRTTVPIWIVVIAQQSNQWSSQFISSIYVEENELALLAVSARIALLVPMILTAVNMVVSPKFAVNYHNGDIGKTEDVLATSLKLLAAVSILIFLFIIFFGDHVLRVFGEKYVEAASLLSILVCGQLVNSLTGPCGKLLMMSGFEKDVRNSSIFVAAISLPLTFYLTDNYGVIGAAIATAMAISMLNLALAWLVNRRLKLNLLTIYLKFFRKPQSS